MYANNSSIPFSSRDFAPRAEPRISIAAAFAACALLGACAQMPTGPTVAVMPGANKPFEVFMQDDQLCRGWAGNSIGQPGNQAASQQMLASTVAGAVIGGLAGAAVGDHHSAGTGAAIGGVIGGTAGANQGAATAWNAQRQYDIAYQQCMYSRGNVVPGMGYRTYRPGVAPPPPPQVPMAPAPR